MAYKIDGCTAFKLLSIYQNHFGKSEKITEMTNDFREKYKAEENITCESREKKRRNLNQIAGLLDKLIVCNAPDSEMDQVFMYALVVMDAVKFNLDWKRARKDFGIIELSDKYNEILRKKLDIGKPIGG